MEDLKRKYRIAMVSYLNSKPFEFGLENFIHHDRFEVITTDPANCAKLFEDGDVDIALMPAGALHDFNGGAEIITDFCIGCDGEVRTVGLFSNVPIEKCDRILADNHSRTSVLLSLVLLNELMGIDLPVVSCDISHTNFKNNDIVLLIGDKVFNKENEFVYKIDLGALWKSCTQLPFVFAVWVAHKHVPSDIRKKLNESCNFGLGKLEQIISQESNENLDLYYYFKQNISYQFDNAKKTALQLFLTKSHKYHKSLTSSAL